MARSADTYRAAKRNAARDAGKLHTWGITNKETPHQFDRLTRKAVMREHFRKYHTKGAPT
jgi:hypothetical protein